MSSMSAKIPPGPFPLREALIVYGDPVALRQREIAERYSRQPAVDRLSDFRLTESGDDDPHGITYPEFEAEKQLALTRERLVLPLLEEVKAERIFLRGVPAGMPNGSPHELIPNGWALELELHIGASVVRRLADRWVSVVATTIVPRADELATSRRLVEESERAVVGHMPEGARPLKLALSDLTDLTLAGAFAAAETEMSRFRQIVAGRMPPDLQGKILIGLDKPSRDLQEHRLSDQLRRARAAVTADFLTRVQDERIVLTGLQIQPQLAAGRSRLSPDWAPHMIFDWDRQAVRAFDNVFVDVQGEARKLAPPRKPPVVRVRAANARGRPSFPFDRFVDIASGPLWRRASQNKLEVEALLAEYGRLYPRDKQPGYRTVLSHIGKIYEAVAAPAVALKSRKSE